MQNPNEPSLEELREESERNREALASTVGELRDRVGDTATELKAMVSPAHIKQEIRDYVRQERESLLDAVQRKATENPLQVAAVAAAVAYPALSVLRALPAPIWLISAGLFLTSKRGRQVAGDVKARLDDAIQQGTENVTDIASSMRSELDDRVAGARYGVEEAQDAVTSTVSGVADKARAVFHDARDAVTGAVQEGTSKATAAAKRMQSSVTAASDAVKSRAEETARTSRYAVTDFVKDNALLVAGIGAVVGAVIAASIPPSDAENRLFGAGSEKLKEKAREAAAQGIERAGDMAANTAGAVAAAAAREGLDSTSVQSALNKVADGVRKVAEGGLDTALGNNKQPSQTPQAFEQTTDERKPS